MRVRLGASLRTLERSFIASIRSTTLPAVASSTSRTTLFSITNTTSLSPRRSPFQLLQLRYASHQAQGRANSGSRDSPGKRLGAKKGSEQYVIPGNIIFRQRGSKWYPGENCAMGRDHTIYATEAGYVKYYLDPELHPKRRYIGVSFERNGTLPTPRNAPTKRRLNMVAVPRVESVGVGADITADIDAATNVVGTVVGTEGATRQELPASKTNLPLRPGYMFREANWQIGRAAEKAGVTAKQFDRRNRWLAWRKRQARAERAAQMKSLRGKKKGASKKAKGKK